MHEAFYAAAILALVCAIGTALLLIRREPDTVPAQALAEPV
jgi:hypothetical protein